MIEELRDRLPEELVWNVLKYTRHPIAEILKPVCEEFSHVKCEFQFDRWLTCHEYIELKILSTAGIAMYIYVGVLEVI